MNNTKFKTLMKKILDTIQNMMILSNRDEIIYGDSYWEFSDRKIELIEPKKIKKEGKYWIGIDYAKKQPKLYGKSILESCENKGKVKNEKRRCNKQTKK